VFELKRQIETTGNVLVQACADFHARRQFLVGQIERVIYSR
jgi:hypothetical protein